MHLSDGEKSFTISAFVHTVPECDGRTDGRICLNNIALCMHCMPTRDNKLSVYVERLYHLIPTNRCYRALVPMTLSDLVRQDGKGSIFFAVNNVYLYHKATMAVTKLKQCERQIRLTVRSAQCKF